jgi:hypothetical protein
VRCGAVAGDRDEKRLRLETAALCGGFTCAVADSSYTLLWAATPGLPVRYSWSDGLRRCQAVTGYLLFYWVTFILRTYYISP